MNGAPISPENTISKFKLPNSAYFTLCRIYSFLSSSSPPLITIHSKIWQYYANTLKSVKGTSLIYRLLQDKMTFHKTNSMIKWETDLKASFTSNPWMRAIRYTYSTTHCVNHWELALKITHRWYLTHYRLVSIYKTSSPLCWYGCGFLGTLVHILWACNSIRSFWRKTFQLISEVTGIITPTDPALALLNIGIDKFPFQFCGIIANILLSGRLILTRHCKQDLAPNPSENVTQQHYLYEKSWIPNLSSSHAFKHLWGP